eukprot:TRINITY_DN2554_c0_g1_i1.p1 TRINITY_DN2554_c0_g1~~TRINITY_DN2554_c0_g1_i1.p1  ORF type:complete len:451 (+),score=85.23 TRINITY_DN2554_c0_g1_i1:111-1355(+)
MDRVVDAGSLVLRICTWNVAEQATTQVDVSAFEEWLLGRSPGLSEQSPTPHLVVVGLQEIDMSGKAMLLGKRGTAKGAKWTNLLETVLPRNGFRPVGDKQLAGIGLWVYAHASIEPSVYAVEQICTPTGFFNRVGNKGAVCSRLKIGGKSICFVNSHLAAHQSKVERRNRDHDRIQSKGRFVHSPQALLAHDYVFWFGDLNYRLDVQSRGAVVDMLAEDDSTGLLRHDQLHRQMRDGKAFGGFSEAGIDWRPTYKLQRGTSVYNAKRTPAYCDRVLFRARASGSQSSIRAQSTGALADSCDGIPSPSLSMLSIPGAADGDESLCSPSSVPTPPTPPPLFCSGDPSRDRLTPDPPRYSSVCGRSCYASEYAGRTPRDTADEDLVRCVDYTSTQDLASSDHRPVHAVFVLSSVNCL